MTTWGLLPGGNELKQVKYRTQSNTWDTAGTRWGPFHLQLLFSSREDGGFGELALFYQKGACPFLPLLSKRYLWRIQHHRHRRVLTPCIEGTGLWQHSFIYSWNSGHLRSAACPERCWRWEAFGMSSPQEGPLPLGERNNAPLDFLLPVLQTFQKLYCENFANSS